MMQVVFILSLIFSDNQERERFGDFYYNKFNANEDFKKSRIKYPLTFTDSKNQVTELKTWGQGIDTLIVNSHDAVFISQTDMMLVTDKRTMKIENIFRTVEGHWYLTKLKILK